MTEPARPDTIVLVHGLWMTPRSWQHWVTYYEAKGLTVLTPGYPGFEIEVEALRENPSSSPISPCRRPSTIWPRVIEAWRPRRSSWATPSAAP